MAEKPGELNDNTLTEEKDEKMIAVMSDASDTENTYLEGRSEEETVSTAEADEEVSPEAEQIRAKIEDTRREMGETIDAIQEKLSFSNISEQVKGEVSEKLSDAWETAKYTTYRKVEDIMGYVNKGIEEVAGTEVARATRSNPIAVTLIGLGVGMLLINYFRGDSSDDYDYDYSRRNLSAGGSSYGDKIGSAAGDAYDAAGETAGKAYGAVAGAASGAYDSVSGAANTAYRGIGDVAGRAYEQVGHLGSSVKDVAGKAYDQYDHYIEENPLAVGAVAMALGAAVGLSIPATRYENKLMGEKRDQLMQQASNQVGDLIRNAGEIAQDKFDRVKNVAETAVDKAKDEAKNQDLI